MKFVAVGKERIYLSDYEGNAEELERLLRSWASSVEAVMTKNLELYHKLYKEVFGIPEGVKTPEEEREFMVARWGEDLLKNEEVVELLREATVKYEEVKNELPSFEDWATEHNLELEIIPYVVEIP